MDQASSALFPIPGDNCDTVRSDQCKEPHSPRLSAQQRISSGHLDQSPRHLQPRRSQREVLSSSRGRLAYAQGSPEPPEASRPSSGDLDLLNKTFTSLAGITIGVLSLVVPFLSVAISRRPSTSCEAPPVFLRDNSTPCQDHQILP